jgi:elongation factor Ts
MAQITASAVQALRTRTGLPMMDCKKALEETGGDAEKAVELLRKSGAKVQEKRSGRATLSGRIAVFAEPGAKAGAIIDLRCESAPVANSPEFIALANDFARQMATGPGAGTPDDLLGQKSPGKPSHTLKEQFDELNNRIREAFKLERVARIDGQCGAYAHHNGAVAVLIQIEGGTPELARDICMHIAAMRPLVVNKEELDATMVAKEREILAQQARNEGKPEKIIEKMVEGRLRDFYAERCLSEQIFVKDETKTKTVGQIAKAAGMKLVRFIHWELPKE